MGAGGVASEQPFHYPLSLKRKLTFKSLETSVAGDVWLSDLWPGSLYKVVRILRAFIYGDHVCTYHVRN